MALTGSTTVTVTPNDQTTMTFSWEAVQDKEAKTSTINWTLTLISKENGGFHDVTDADVYTWTVIIDGQEFTGYSNIKIDNSTSKVLGSGSAVLTHSEDGTKTFEYSFTQNFGHVTWHDGSTIDDVTGTGSAELDPFVEKFDILSCVNGYIMSICGSPRHYPGKIIAGAYNKFPITYTMRSVADNAKFTFSRGLTMVKISDLTPNYKELMEWTITTYNDDTPIRESAMVDPISANNDAYCTFYGSIYSYRDSILCVCEKATDITPPDTEFAGQILGSGTVAVPEPGIYATYDENDTNTYVVDVSKDPRTVYVLDSLSVNEYDAAFTVTTTPYGSTSDTYTYSMVKVSDRTMTAEDMWKSAYGRYDTLRIYFDSVAINWRTSDICDEEGYSHCYIENEPLIVSVSDTSAYSSNGVHPPETGIYLAAPTRSLGISEFKLLIRE